MYTAGERALVLSGCAYMTFYKNSGCVDNLLVISCLSSTVSDFSSVRWPTFSLIQIASGYNVDTTAK